MTRCKFFTKRLGSIFLIFFAASFITFSQSSTNRAPAMRHPSILFILADDLGYGDLGCYGQAKIKTPNIDKLAAQGMRFTSCYAGSTVCAASRASLMTGKDTGHSRIRGNGTVSLQAEDLTVGEVLKKAGYSSGAIGKWGMGEAGSAGVPGKKGFDQWLGYLNQVAAHDYYPEFLNRSGVDFTKDIQVRENIAGGKGMYSDDFFTTAALNFIKNESPHWHNHYRPFFLYLPYTLPHANNELGVATGNGMQVPEDSPYSQEQWPQVEKNKAAMITRLDRYVGSLMDQLKKFGTEDNTVVIFASDNGPHKEGGVNPDFFASSGRLRGIKRDLYEGGIRVPLIISWPQRILPGTVSDLPCAFWDILPTFAEIAQQPAPKDIQGISILPTLIGQVQTNQHKFLYWESHEGRFKQAVRMGDWKGVRIGIDGPLELYNLKTDLSEKVNVAADFPKVVEEMETFLKTARTEDKNWPVKTVAEMAASGAKDNAPK